VTRDDNEKAIPTFKTDKEAEDLSPRQTSRNTIFLAAK